MYFYDTYFAEIREESWLSAGSCKLLVKQLAFDCLVLVLWGLQTIGRLHFFVQIHLLDELTEQIFVEVGSEFFGKLSKWLIPGITY